MICEFCEHLKISDGDKDLPPFSCAEVNNRQVFNPYVKQRWCPKVGKRNAKTPQRQDTTIQTDFEEMKFVDSLPQEKLAGYVKGLMLRDQNKTDFNIKMLLAYANGKIK